MRYCHGKKVLDIIKFHSPFP